MSRRPSSWEHEERRNARIRELREQREGPVRRRRRIQPLLLLAWIAGTIALLGVLIVLGFNVFFAPRVMAWVEENPGAIEHGIVQDFVKWYAPEELADEPASTEHRRVTIQVESGATDTSIGQMLFDQGLIKSRVAFQYAIIQAGREGTLPVGVFDLSPTLKPSEIVAALQGQEFAPTTTVTIREGLRLEEVVAAFAQSEMTMNMEEFAAILEAPPAEILNEFDFLADLPAGRSLEGYIPPDTYEFEISGDRGSPTFIVREGGKPALGLGVSMADGANILTLGENLKQAMKSVTAELPIGIEVTQIADQPHIVDESVSEFVKSFGEALAIVLVVGFLSLGWRTGIVVALSVPLVLAIVLLVMYGAGLDLHRITLGALIIALGLLVDDAIIAIEMMVVKMEQGWDRVRAATYAWTSTAFPMLTGTLVTAAGFLPVGFANSSTGEYAGGIFWVVGLALIASWIVAVVFTPYLGLKLLPDFVKHRAHDNPDALYDTRVYRALRRAAAESTSSAASVLSKR
mgnify:CR=1 FL=1